MGAKLLLISMLWLVVSTAGSATPYELSYGGRLTDNLGKPVTGPVDLRVTFYRSVSGTDQVVVPLADFTGVMLQDGIFEIPISLSAADFHTLFNGVNSVFIQVEDLTHSLTYPRQKFSAVPYALKVPVDGTSITFNANGRLSLGNGSTTFTLPATAGSPHQVLKTNGSGVLTWANDETTSAGSVTSTAIADDTIVNSDINTNAAIAGSKINPDFGTQNVVTTGSVTAASFAGNGSALTNLPVGPLGTSIESSEIANDTIVNEDINANAAIAGSKINPDFGMQNVVTTGSVTATSFSGNGSALTNLPVGPLGSTIELDGAEVTSVLPVAKGGTGATSQAEAQTNLGLGSMATQAANSANITGGSITGLTTLSSNGYFKPGAGTAADCDGTKAGMIRYNSSSLKLELCNGSVWAEPGSTGSIPTGTIAFFNLASCPTGWTDKTASIGGRYLVAKPTSGTLGGIVGTALSDQENRAVGKHSHGVTDPGHNHSLGTTTSGNGSPYVYQGYAGTWNHSFKTSTSTTGISIQNAGTVDGTNAPYIQYLACEKE